MSYKTLNMIVPVAVLGIVVVVVMVVLVNVIVLAVLASDDEIAPQ